MSTHPIARGIVNSLDGTENPDLFKEVNNKNGLGVVAISKENEEVKLGSAKFIGIENEDVRAVYLAIDDKPVARVIIEDEIKKESKKTVEKLKEISKKSQLYLEIAKRQ